MTDTPSESSITLTVLLIILGALFLIIAGSIIYMKHRITRPKPGTAPNDNTKIEG